MPIISLFFAVFILAGGIVAGFGVRNIIQAHESRNWLPADGKITASEVERRRSSKGRGSYSPSVKYEYTVDGQKYDGETIAIGMKNVSAGQGFARRFVSKYPAGKSVQVFYNPALPGHSVLEPGLSKRSFILFAFGISFALVGTCFATVAWLFS